METVKRYVCKDCGLVFDEVAIVEVSSRSALHGWCPRCNQSNVQEVGDGDQEG